MEGVLFAEGTSGTAADMLALAVPGPSRNELSDGRRRIYAVRASSDISTRGRGRFDRRRGRQRPSEGGTVSDVLRGAWARFYYYDAVTATILRDWEVTVPAATKRSTRPGPGLDRRPVESGRAQLHPLFGGGEEASLSTRAAGASGNGIEFIPSTRHLHFRADLMSIATNAPRRRCLPLTGNRYSAPGNASSR